MLSGKKGKWAKKTYRNSRKKKPDDHLRQTRSGWWQRDLKSFGRHASGGSQREAEDLVRVPEDNGKKENKKRGRIAKSTRNEGTDTRTAESRPLV